MGRGGGVERVELLHHPHRGQPLAVLVAAAYKARGFGKSEGTVQGQAALIGGGDNSDDLPESLPRQAGQERLVQPAANAAAARRIRSQKDGQLGK